MGSPVKFAELVFFEEFNPDGIMTLNAFHWAGWVGGAQQDKLRFDRRGKHGA